MARLARPVAAFVATLFLVAFGASSGETGATRETAAVVNGEPISMEQVESAIGAPLAKLEEQIYVLKRRRLDALILERLLAKEAAKRGISVRALLVAEVDAKADAVTDEELDAAVKKQRAAQPGAEEATLHNEAKSHLRLQKVAARRQAFLASLRADANVVVELQPPPVYRADVGTPSGASKGPSTAPVTLVEFQDFHCPFCRQVQPTLFQIAARYGDRVRLVFRDFPIDELHPKARRVHEAARCALDQGKFWEFHDVIYTNAKDDEDLVNLARRADLDIDAFSLCVADRRHQADVQRDIDDGLRVGVTGTPSFFINGRPVSGALPLDAFARVIDEELRAH